jgi:hypothetical protein
MAHRKAFVDCLESLSADISHGDILVMFAALYNRLKTPKLSQNRNDRPDRTRVIQNILKKEFGIPGLPVWGASAVRGHLNDDKEHIKRAIDIVNDLPAVWLPAVWEQAGRWYLQRMEASRKPIVLNPQGGIFTIIRRLAQSRTVGVTQQGICYAATKVYCEGLGPEYEIRSKRTWAGDAQSRCHGDIDIRHDGTIVNVLEVKAHLVDADKLAETLEPHGKHDYCLCIVAEGFADSLEDRENLLFIVLEDSLASTLSHAAVVMNDSVEAVGLRVLNAYNECMRDIEDRPDLMVKLGTQADDSPSSGS